MAVAKTAFLFPGQGSQFAGMGKSLAQAYPEAARVFAQADAALEFPLSQLCFEGPDEELKRTENTQPAMLTVSIAAYEVLRGKGLQPDFVAGHSLGEYSALVAAGALDFTDAVRLVRKRGRFMQEAVPAGAARTVSGCDWLEPCCVCPKASLRPFCPRPRKAKWLPPQTLTRRIRLLSPATPRR